jgi:hypothetical protein
MRQRAAGQQGDDLPRGTGRVRSRLELLRGGPVTPQDVLRVIDAGGTLALCLILWGELRRVRDALDILGRATTQLVTMLDAHERREESIRPVATRRATGSP